MPMVELFKFCKKNQMSLKNLHSISSNWYNTLSNNHIILIHSISHVLIRIHVFNLFWVLSCIDCIQTAICYLSKILFKQHGIF